MSILYKNILLFDMLEEWKFYKETKQSNQYRKGTQIYEISSLGRVRINGKIVEPKLHSSGYLCIANTCIHRIVAKLFIPNPDNKKCVDHINTIKTDNRLENLRWVTYSENMLNPLTREHNKHTSYTKGKHRVYREDGSFYMSF